MRGILRFVVPAIISLYSLVLLPELRSGFRFVNPGDLPGVYISLAALPLLLPAGLFAIISPKMGGVMLAIAGWLGVLGILLTPSFLTKPFYVGLGPAMFLIAMADGLLIWWFEKR